MQAWMRTKGDVWYDLPSWLQELFGENEIPHFDNLACQLPNGDVLDVWDAPRGDGDRPRFSVRRGTDNRLFEVGDAEGLRSYLSRNGLI